MKRLLLGLAVIIAAAVLGKIWWDTSLLPVGPTGSSPGVFTVVRGAGVREISRDLKDRKLIRDQVAFFLYVKLTGLEKKIQAGDFRLSPTMSAPELAESLTHGTLDIWITLPEGWRTEEILEYLAKTDPSWTATASEAAQWRSEEGKLFPDTYLVPKGATLSDIKRILLNTYSQKVTPDILEQARAESLTEEQLLTIASLVEREARTESDRPIVADIILKRLRDSGPLQIDAAVQYAVGKNDSRGWWPKDLTEDELKVKSPYNTYLYPGLPPGPICNPGISAIKAVASRARTPYYYYISDKSGQMHYAKTLLEHNQNVAKYLQ